MNKAGLISIIIPTFNRAELLRETLDSIVNQSYKNWECLVIDDHSTDHTLETIQAFELLDSRFKSLKNINKKGAPGARNTGIKHAIGEYIYFFDSDNLMLPNTLGELLKAFEEKDVDISVCHATVVDDLLQPIGKFAWNCYGNIHNQLINGETYVDYNIALIKKVAINRFGLTDENCPSYQEWDTHIRLSQNSIYVTTEKQLVIYRKSAKNTISSDVYKSSKGFLYILIKHEKLFLKNKVGFRNQGLNLLKNAKESQDYLFLKEIRKELNSLIPGFRFFIFRVSFNSYLHRVKDKFKKYLKRKD